MPELKNAVALPTVAEVEGAIAEHKRKITALRNYLRAIAKQESAALALDAPPDTVEEK